MAKNICVSCGVEADSNKEWKKCPQCETHFCPTCVDKTRQEREQLHKLRHGTAYERTEASCPSCNAALHNWF